MPGVNLSAGLSVVRGNPQKYLNLLRRFVANHRDDPALMTLQLATGDLAAVGQLAHTLKGVAATLGAQAIADAGARLDRVLREDSPEPRVIDALIQGIDQALTPFAAALDGLPECAGESPAADDLAGSDPRHTEEVLRHLVELLVACDTRAIDVLHEHMPMLRASLGTQFDVLKDALSQFDFEAGVAALPRRFGREVD